MHPMDLRILDNLDALSAAAADLFHDTAARCAADGRPAFIALSGGSTPKRMCALLAMPPRRDAVRWENVELFWVDERPVPPDHPDSNERMVRESLLDHVPLPPERVHPIPAGRMSPLDAALAYENTLKQRLPRTPDGWPRFDLVFLGMGDDGHTASLFPGSPGLREGTRWVIANPVEKLGVERITLTFPVLNHAVRVAFLVSGDSKRAAFRHVRAGEGDTETLPSLGVRPEDGALLWLVDRDAAGAS